MRTRTRVWLVPFPELRVTDFDPLAGKFRREESSYARARSLQQTDRYERESRMGNIRTPVFVGNNLIRPWSVRTLCYGQPGAS